MFATRRSHCLSFAAPPLPSDLGARSRLSAPRGERRTLSHEIASLRDPYDKWVVQRGESCAVCWTYLFVLESEGNIKQNGMKALSDMYLQTMAMSFYIWMPFSSVN